MWSNLSALIVSFRDTKILIISYLNSVISAAEKEHCEFNKSASRNFTNFMKSNTLLDIPLVNSFFTWFCPSNKKSRLDKALANANWVEIGDWVLLALPRKNSDHKSLLLKCSNLKGGPKPFKFFNCCLENQSLIQQLGLLWRMMSQKISKQSSSK